MPRIPLTMLLVSACLLALSAAVPAQGIAATEAPAASSDTAAPIEILPADGFDLSEYLWVSRVLVVFADTPADPRYVKQIQQIEARPRDLLERDVIVVSDTDPAAKSALRSELRPRGFALVLVDKDGDVKLRKPAPWGTREIARSIDKTPLRRQEIQERRGTGLQ